MIVVVATGMATDPIRLKPGDSLEPMVAEARKVLGTSL
jgi:hypothetical protein